MSKQPTRHMRRAPQRGIALLTIVMVLAFMLLLTAGFVNRNQVFEQRTAANQYRATQALELAEAGAEWTLALLNGGRVDAKCLPSAASTDATLADRYLSMDATTGNVKPLSPASSASSGTVALQPVCVRTDGGWSCTCPSKDGPALALPADAATRPAFAVTFDKAAISAPNVIGLTVSGCTRFDSRCSQSNKGAADAVAMLHLQVALVPALRTKPAAALTARGAVHVGDGTLDIRNTDPRGNGFTIHAGAGVDTASMLIVSAPGTPQSASVAASDAAWAGLNGGRMFASFFGMDKPTYKMLPAVAHVACGNGDCTKPLQDAYTAGHRIVWASTGLEIKDAVIGSTADPLILIAEGPVRWSGDVQFHGLVYSMAPTWNDAGTGRAAVRGAVVAEGDYCSTGTPTYLYDLDILNRLTRMRGAFAKVPGSWTDARPQP